MADDQENDASSVKAAQYLVVDTVGFLKNAPFHEYAEHAVTVRDVITEIRDKATRQRLEALPYPIDFVDPDTESLKKVTDFSKKTGDFGSLSVTDMKVLALTYMLEAKHAGTTSHLRDEPIVKKTVEFYKPQPDSLGSSKIAGFYKPKDDEEDEGETPIDVAEAGNDSAPPSIKGTSEGENNEDHGSEDGVEDHAAVEHEDDEEDGEDDDDDGDGSFEDSGDEEDDGWITPMNVAKKKSQMMAMEEKKGEDRVLVACMTSDFAMQNVLISMGLHVISPNGVVIKETKTWILRCYACYKTTPLMDKKFCPKCGNESLKRVSVTLNPDGSQEIHISTRRVLTARGKKFSLPMPRGGKHAVNPVLSEDQQFAQQRRTRLARSKTDALNPDYIYGNNPFSVNDVTSKSALIGVGKKSDQYWLRKNPNAVGKRTGNRKKKRIVAS